MWEANDASAQPSRDFGSPFAYKVASIILVIRCSILWEGHSTGQRPVSYRLALWRLCVEKDHAVLKDVSVEARNGVSA